MSVTAAAIPRALTKRPQWVVWRYEERDGKVTKVPYGVTTGRRASTNADDPFAGVDLNCRNPITGEIDEWAQDIVNALNSYTEVSPSGTGLKVFLKGNLP